MPRANYRDIEPAPSLKGWRAWLDDRPQLPYLAPFLIFVAVMFPTAFGEPWVSIWKHYFPFIYALKTILAAILLVIFWHRFTPIRWTHLPLGVMAGLVGTVLWVGIEYACQYFHLSHAPNPADLYIPDRDLHATAARWGYLCVRIAGPTLVVPIMEELFFRDFLMRATIRGARFQDVPVGTFTWFSLIATSILFGINHGLQWPEGIAYGLLMGILLIRTKSLGSCIVAHATTNLTLYLYVVYFGDWQFL